jgi:N-methylhydantoinase A
LHVCALADALQIPAIVVPLRSGVFSALGMLVADRARQLIKTVNRSFDALSDRDVAAYFDALALPGRLELQADGEVAETIVERRFADLRYRGQSFALTVPWTNSEGAVQTFHARHELRYGHAFDLPVELVNVRSELSVPQPPLALPRLVPRKLALARSRAHAIGYGDVPLYERLELAEGQSFDGPALIVEAMSTAFIEPGWSTTVDAWGNLRLARRSPPGAGGTT